MPLSHITRQRYTEARKQFDRWCRSRGIEPLLASGSDMCNHIEEALSARRPIAVNTALLRLYALNERVKASGRRISSTPIRECGSCARLSLRGANRDRAARYAWSICDRCS